MGASYFTMKLFGGPGEPKDSLGEPRVRKSVQMTLLPSILGIFRIPYRNVEKPSYYATTGAKQLNSASNNQNFSK